jgi:hypothetical protein
VLIDWGCAIIDPPVEATPASLTTASPCQLVQDRYALCHVVRAVLFGKQGNVAYARVKTSTTIIELLKDVLDWLHKFTRSELFHVFQRDDWKSFRECVIELTRAAADALAAVDAGANIKILFLVPLELPRISAEHRAMADIAKGIKHVACHLPALQQIPQLD